MDERRQGYIDIEKRLIRLETLQEEYNKTDEKWRERFCLKLDNLIETTSKLPCDGRKTWYQGMSKQVAFMWVVISGMILGLYLSLSAQTSAFNGCKEDISFIKQHSYGVQEYFNGRKTAR